MKRNFVKLTVAVVVITGVFAACDKGNEVSSNYVGTWQSVGYYNRDGGFDQFGKFTSDVSEKITFEKKGKGEYEANGSKKSFEWEAYEIGIYISIASSIHDDNKWGNDQREHKLEANKLTIFWSNRCEMVYEKIK